MSGKSHGQRDLASYSLWGCKRVRHEEANNNKNTTIQNLWHAAKAILRGKFTQAFFKKQEKYKINNLIHHLKELEKEQTKPTFSRREEITKIREEINKIEI